MTEQQHSFSSMPPKAPLAIQVQSFSHEPEHVVPSLEDPEASGPWRAAVFIPALIGTGALVYALYGWLSNSGMTGLEWCLLVLIGLTFIWSTLSVSTVGVALAGLLARHEQDSNSTQQASPMNVALLVPIYNENVGTVFGNAKAMLDDLARTGSPHHYSLFLLSDTQETAIAEQEVRVFADLAGKVPKSTNVYYRRRTDNIDKKVGNLLDWITNWGAEYDAMVVLDADSLMTGRAIDRLTQELSMDTTAGLIQSCPVLIDADTVFARAQQFSNMAYGWLLAEGLATWVKGEGNYWGHNAIIRTRAFAASAGLPYLKRRNGREDLILSHDFVEAGLLRRAGWRVRFLPRISGSFEETPSTLVDYAMRDERWCRGNLQHLRLLTTAGMHPVSRYHLLHGAVSYLLSPAWFTLLVFWFLLGKDTETNVIRYFNEANPLFPNWPPAMSHIDSAIFLVIMYAMLLTPKIVGAMAIGLHPKAARLYGGRTAFIGAFLTELIVSIAYAPILMVQQTRSVLGASFGKRVQWRPQNRNGRGYPLALLLRFHWLESILGCVLSVGLFSGLVSLWLLPIAGSLLLSVPLSMLSARPVSKCLPKLMHMNSPHSLREPFILRRARKARTALERTIDPAGIAAE